MSVTYLPHPNSQYRGNPYIEALGLPLDKKSFVRKVNQTKTPALDLSGVPESLHDYYTRSAIDNIENIYVVRDEAYRLYDRVRRMIESSYQHRNPLSPNYNRLLVAITRDQSDPIASTNVSRLGLPRSQSAFLCGLSGLGKSTMVQTILDQIPQFLDHSSYVDESGTEHRLNVQQITYIYTEVYHRRSSKDFLKQILATIDETTGNNYTHEYRNENATALIARIRKLIIIHGIGLIVVDECQNLSKHRPTDEIRTNERVSMEFLEELFNSIGVAMFFIGTHAMIPLLSDRITTGRRASKSGSEIMETCNVDSSFWNRFIMAVCPLQYMKKQKTDIDTIIRHVHYLSCGIPAIASSLVRSTMAYLTFLEPKNQDLSMAALDKIFSEEFRVLKPALQALKKGHYHQFDDLNPMAILESIDKDSERMDRMAAIASNVIAPSDGGTKNSDQLSLPKGSAKRDKQPDELSLGKLMTTLGHDIEGTS